MTILKEYVEAVTKRADDYLEAEQYYEGVVGEFFASAKLRAALRTTGHHGQHNYCRVVVDAVLHRLEIANVIADKATAQKKVKEVWDANELDLEANEIHRTALEYGDCYALVWPDEEGDLLVSYNSPRTTTIVYDPENPRKKLYAVKMWIVPSPIAENKTQTRMNVYLPDRIQKYITDASLVTEGTNWRGIGQEDNPFGEIPVFHFRTARPYGKPEHKEAYGPQNDINKLLATHFYTIDYQGAPQRYALSVSEEGSLDFNDSDGEASDVEGLRASPGSMWYLKGVNQVGQFQAVDPKVFWEPIGSLKQSMAALTDTPFHYLEKPAAVSGGQAQRVSEAPLLKKVADRQTSFGATWKELWKFILTVEGFNDVDIEIKWDDVESFDALDTWDVMLKKVNAGLSHAQALREGGYTEAEIEKIMAEREAEKSNSQFYNRTDVNGQQSLQNAPAARISADNNLPNNENRNGLTEAAKGNNSGKAAV